MSTFCFTIFVDKRVKVKVRLSLWHLGNAFRMAVVSRLKSHLSGKWLLIRNISCWSLSRSPKLFEQSARIFWSRASSLNDRFRFSAFTSTSILLRTKKKVLPIDFIFLANFKSFSVNRLPVKIRNKWYLSKSTCSQYFSRSGNVGVPIPGKSQSVILGFWGWSYAVGSLAVFLPAPTSAAFLSSSGTLEKTRKSFVVQFLKETRGAPRNVISNHWEMSVWNLSGLIFLMAQWRTTLVFWNVYIQLIV